MNILDTTAAHLEAARFDTGTRLPGGFYPSAASIQYLNSTTNQPTTLGKCIRDEWYFRKGFKPSDPANAYQRYMMLLGKKVEEMLISIWKEMGIFVTSNARFSTTIKGIPISGELDTVIRDPKTEQSTLIEIKSFYGYMASKEILGTKGKRGQPKLEHLMQTFLYAYLFRMGNGEREEIPKCKIIYLSRDNAGGAEFDIDLIQDGDNWWPAVDGLPFEQINLNAILTRFEVLKEALEKDAPPPRDYKWKYNDQEMEAYRKAGLIGKTNYDKWVKSPSAQSLRTGDWRCRYCQFHSLCLNDEPRFTVPGYDIKLPPVKPQIVKELAR